MIAFVGDAPSAADERSGVLFSDVAGRILEDAMVEAGVRREASSFFNVFPRRFGAPDVAALHDALRHAHPRVIVALGAQAAHALIEEWPDGRSREGLVHRGNIRGACDVEARRGYVFDSCVDGLDAPIIVSIHPREVLDTWTPWRTLLSFDLQRAQELVREPLRRPVRQVDVVSSRSQSRSALAYLRRFDRLSADLENRGDLSVACLGFAGESGRSVVFPSQYLDDARELLRSPSLTTVWVNGIYDLYVLKHREGFEIAGRVDDAMILWHAAYPELAGAREDKRKHRFTRKSLSFLASLATFDAWWKCLHEDTPVLMADLSWRALKEVQTGDEVVAFTEDTREDKKRTWEIATVVGKKLQRKQCLRVQTIRGSLIGTPCHKVLATPRGGRKGWYRLDELKPGIYLHFLERWKKSTTYEAGWLAGFADGEGTIRRSLNQQTGAALTIAQKAGPLLTKAHAIAIALGFDVRIHGPEKITPSLYFAGGTRAVFKALGTFHPDRLVHNFVNMLRSRLVSMRTEKAVILSIDDMGEMPVGDIATTAGTFVADGFAVHNSYNFTTEDERFVLNGRDCCITLDVWDFVAREADVVGAWSTYEHERSLMWPCVDMLHRGLRVNERLRVERMTALARAAEEESSKASQALLPLLERERDTLREAGVLHLFEETEGVCSCCRHAVKKQARCWGCAGFEKAPAKAEMMAAFGIASDTKVTKAELEARLAPCVVCDARPRETRWVLNLNSDAQVKTLLYDVLKLPKRFGRNAKGESVLKADEATLKSLLSGLPT